MKKLLFLLLLLSFVVSCQREAEDDSPVVATVGKAKLTLNDIRNALPKEAGLELSGVQIQRFVQRWIEFELIYQEALKRGVPNQPEVKKGLKELEKEYIVSAFIDQFVDVNLNPDEDEIRQYYEANSDEFIRPEDMYNLRLILVETYRKANAIRQELIRGTNFADLAKQHSLDPSSENGGEKGWVRLADLPEDLARRIPNLALNTPSVPLKTKVGYYIVEPLGLRKKGSLMTLEEVKETIKLRLRAKKKEDRYRQLVTQLGEKTLLTTDWSVLESESLGTPSEPKQR